MVYILDKNDKNHIMDICSDLFQEGIAKYIEFVKNGQFDEYQKIEPSREEKAVNSRYLHRGYYCPSPLFEVLVTNTRRGKILARQTKNSKITHRYLYDSDDNLYLVENYYNGQCTMCEFILIEENKRYGFTFYNNGELCSISIEMFSNEKLQSYIWISCSKGYQTDEFLANFAYYETFAYDGEVMSEWDFISVVFRRNKDSLGSVNHRKYRPLYENGQIKDIEFVHF